MRKQFLLTALFAILLGTMGAWAQAPGKLAGKVTNEKNAGLAAVTVSLLTAADSSLVKSEISDNTGRFELVVQKPGAYLVSFTQVGFERKYSAVVNLKEGETIELPGPSPAIWRLSGPAFVGKMLLFGVSLREVRRKRIS